jgi:hypothetical protein
LDKLRFVSRNKTPKRLLAQMDPELAGPSALPPFDLSLKNIAAIRAALTGMPDSQLKAVFVGVEEIASIYLRRKSQDSNTTDRSQARDLLGRIAPSHGAVLRRTVGQLGISPDAEFEMRKVHDRHGKSDAEWNDALVYPNKHEHYLRALATEAGSHLKVRPGPQIRPSLHLLVQDLCSLYEEATGQWPTHNPYIKTNYRGTPQSEGGRFVVAAMAAIEPGLLSRQVATVMRFVVAAGQKTLKGG